MTRHASRVLAPLLLALGSLGAAAPAGAAPFAFSGPGNCPDPAGSIADPVAACVRIFGFNTGPLVDTEVGAPLAGVAADTQGTSGPTAAGNTTVSSAVGIGSVVSHAEKSGASSFGASDVTGWVNWEDSVTLSAPGLAGQSGTFQAAIRVDLDHTLSLDLQTALSVNANAAYSLIVTTDDTGWQFVGNTQVSDSQAQGPQTTVTGDPAGVLITGNLGFQFGTPFELSSEASLNIEAGANGPVGFATADASLDVRWLGITQVLDAGGSPVSGFSVTSGSGVDFANAVPEPAVAVLGLVLLTAGGWARRRRA